MSWELVATPTTTAIGGSTTLTATFYADGVATDPGLVTLGVVDVAGVTVLAAGTPTTEVGTLGMRLATLPAQSQTNQLVVTWTAATAGIFSVGLEVWGGVLFSVSEARGFGGMVNNATPLANTPLVAIDATRARITEEFAGILGYALLPTYEYVTQAAPTGYGTWSLRTREGTLATHIRSIRSVETRALGATSWTPVTIIDDGGDPALPALSSSVCGQQLLRVGYEHGLDRPPPAIKEAALKLAVYLLTPSNISERALQLSDQLGVIQLSTPDAEKGRHYGLPFVDTVLNRHAEFVAAIA